MESAPHVCAGAGILKGMPFGHVFLFVIRPRGASTQPDHPLYERKSYEIRTDGFAYLPELRWADGPPATKCQREDMVRHLV